MVFRRDQSSAHFCWFFTCFHSAKSSKNTQCVVIHVATPMTLKLILLSPNDCTPLEFLYQCQPRLATGCLKTLFSLIQTKLKALYLERRRKGHFQQRTLLLLLTIIRIFTATWNQSLNQHSSTKEYFQAKKLQSDLEKLFYTFIWSRVYCCNILFTGPKPKQTNTLPQSWCVYTGS